MGIPEIRRGIARPVSAQIADWLRHRIKAGDFTPDTDRLPSEQELMRWFDVSRDTARRVHEILRDEGLVYTVPQRGTFVLPAGVARLRGDKLRNGGGNHGDVRGGSVWRV